MRKTATAQLEQIQRQLAALPVGARGAARTRGAEDIAAEEARIAETAKAEQARLLEQTRREIAMRLRDRPARADRACGTARRSGGRVSASRARSRPTISCALLDRYATQLGEAPDTARRRDDARVAAARYARALFDVALKERRTSSGSSASSRRSPARARTRHAPAGAVEPRDPAVAEARRRRAALAQRRSSPPWRGCC